MGRALEGAAADPGPAKYPRCTHGGRPGQEKAEPVEGTSGKAVRHALGDITNVRTAPRQATCAGVFTLGSKGSPSPICDEAESTGLGGLVGHMSCSDEDVLGDSDFEDFPVVGSDSSRVPGAPTTGRREDTNDSTMFEMFPSSVHRTSPSAFPLEDAQTLRPSRELIRSRSSRAAGSAEDVAGGLRVAVEREQLFRQATKEVDVATGGSQSDGEAERRLESLLSHVHKVHMAPLEFDIHTVVGDSDDDDPQRVSEYLLDIFTRLGRDEANPQMPQPDYMEGQPELNAHMRAVAIDWLVEVQVKFKLRTETLFLAVSLLDRFLAIKRVKKRDLQLVIVCATFIAAKFEEIDPPDVRDFVFITKQACSKDSILSMEVTMLTVLEFCLCCPTAAHFLEKYQRSSRCTEEQRHLLQYILELSLMDLRMARFPPSVQAAAAVLLGNGILRQQAVWPPDMARLADGAEALVRHCAAEMCCLLEAARTSPLQAIRRKFLRPEYHGVALLEF